MREETKRLYFDDPYCTEFEARVLERHIHRNLPALILDQTCFYPESGGQPSDRGMINGIEVVDVVEQGDQIMHVVREDVHGEKVVGKIDWPRRFDHMQQHAGQHILSQSFYELLKAGTLSFHLGEAFSTLEMDLSEVNEEKVEKVERRANAIVFEDREIKSYFMNEEEVQSIPLRRPPKKKGLLRIIEVQDYDYSACGGTHPRRTGEVGLIKILGWERIRGHLRFEFICGKRAIEDYIMKNRILRELSSRLTVHEKDVLSTVEKLSSDFKLETRRSRKIREKLVQYEAKEIVQNARGKIIRDIFTGRSREELRLLAVNIIKFGPYVVLYGLKDERGVHLVLARSEDVGIDLRYLVPELSTIVRGRGGGSSSLVEIAGEKAEGLPQALERACDFVEKELGKTCPPGPYS